MVRNCDEAFTPRLHRNAVEAFEWLISVLKKHKVPYQFSGGFAAKIYGAKRSLVDIDVDIPEDAFATLVKDVQPYLLYGPKMWRGEGFKVYLMTLNFKGQPIDIGGAYKTQIWHRKKKTWIPLATNLNEYCWKKVLNLRIKVIPKDELVKYKSMLNRRVDKKDLRDIA